MEGGLRRAVNVIDEMRRESALSKGAQNGNLQASSDAAFMHSAQLNSIVKLEL